MQNFNNLKVAELKELAKRLGVEGADSMKKDDLIKALMSHNGQLPGNPDVTKDESESVMESSSKSSDIEKHPKFAKFKKGVK